MHGTRLACAALLLLAGHVAGQSTMYAIDWPGNFVEVDRATGAATLIGATGFTSLNAAAADSQGRIFTHSATADELILLDALTGAGPFIWPSPVAQLDMASAQWRLIRRIGCS